MTDAGPQRPCEQDLMFFGRVGAQVSHDMRNVLAVIKEYAGLLDDMLVLAQTGRALDAEKLRNTAAKISKQVVRGTEQMERFSRFAHAADERVASFDLAEMLPRLAELSQKQAAKSGCRVEASPPKAAIPMQTNVFRVQRAIFAAISAVAKAADVGETIAARAAGGNGTATVSLYARAAAGDDETLVTNLAEVLSELGGTAAASRAAGVLTLELTIPTT